MKLKTEFFGRKRPNQKLFLLAGLLISLIGLAVEVVAAPGDLDPTFGAGGKVVTTEFRPDPAAGSNAMAADIQPDGKIVVAGTTSELAGTFYRSYLILARYNPNGSLDTAFGTGGKVVTDIAGTQVEVYALALQADGKILVGGTTIGASANTDGNQGYNFALVRFNTNGTIDTSFGVGGIASTDYSGGTTNDDKIYALAVQSDGKIVAAGYARAGDFVNFAMARYNANGTIDTAFGTGGKVSTALSNGTDVIRAVRLQPDGKIVAVGYAVTASGFDFALARYNFNGSLDPTFGTSGLVFTDFGNAADDSAYAAVLQPDGKIVAGGSGRMPGSTSGDFALARYNADGSLDSSFGTGGKTSINFFGLADRIHALVLQTNGKIAAAGYSTMSTSGFSHTDFALARFNANGTIDSGFGTDGKTTTSFVNAVAEDRAFALVLQPDGKIVAAGFGTTQPNTSSRLALARYIGDAPLAPRGKLFDFDGDGKADVSVFRPSNGVWYLNQSTSGFAGVAFGLDSDKIVPSDYDGDGKTDVAVYRGGVWYLQRSQSGFTGVSFGSSDDIPVPADFDGDGKSELALFRPSNGTWYFYNLAINQTSATVFGQTGDKPVAADYDGDSKSDIAVFRNGIWYIQRSQLGFTAVQFGEATDKATPADYDGDGKTDIAVFRPSLGTWYLQQSTAGFTGVQFGLGTDAPVAADYDGDGKADIAVFRNGVWYLQRSQAGFTGMQFGSSTDRPVINVFVQ